MLLQPAVHPLCRTVESGVTVLVEPGASDVSRLDVHDQVMDLKCPGGGSGAPQPVEQPGASVRVVKFVMADHADYSGRATCCSPRTCGARQRY